MEMIYNEESNFCGIRIYDNDKKLSFELISYGSKKRPIEIQFEVPKHCTDENKLNLIENIKQWYIINKQEELAKPEFFINYIMNDLKKTLRIREWMTIDQLKEKRQNLYNSIDRYTEYIESYEQQQRAEKNNREIYILIDLCDKVIDQMEELQKQYLNVGYAYGIFKADNNFFKFKREN